MGSPLGPTLLVFFDIMPVHTGRKLNVHRTFRTFRMSYVHSIYVLCLRGWKKWLIEYPPQFKPVVYRCYVNDVPFFNYITKKKNYKKFTLIPKGLNSFSVLNVQITCKNKCFVVSILRKATFSGVFTNYDSFIFDIYHSYKKQIKSGNTSRPSRNLYLMLKFTELSKTSGITSKEAWLSLKGINCLQVIFVLIWMKQTLIWFNLQIDGTGNGLSNIKHTFAESLQLKISVLHQNMCIFKNGLSSSYDGYEHAIPNSSLHKLKIYSSKRCRKISQRWIICMYLANKAVLNIGIYSRRYYFR